MPTFHITDPDTGRTIQMTGAKPPAEADIKAAFAKEPQQQPQSSPLSGIESGASSVMRGLGLGVIPDAVSGLMNLPKEAGAIFGGDQAKQQYTQSVANNSFTDPNLSQALNSGDKNQVGQAVSQLGTGVGGFNNAMGLTTDVKGAMGVAKGVGTLAKGAGYALTHPTMESAVNAQKAAVTGGSALHDLTPAIQKSLQEATSGEHKFNANVAKEVQNIWDTKLAAPLTHEEVAFRNNGAGMQTAFKGVSKLTAEDLLNLRKAVGKQAAFGSNKYSDGAAANKIVYRAINDMLKGAKGVAPKLKAADKLLSAYSNPFFKEGPHIPFTGIKVPYPQNFQGLPAGAINALLAGVVGDEAVKKLGL